jgi:putative ABC transport system permease protein
LGPFVAKQYDLNVNEWFARGNTIDLKLMPVSKIHLHASNISGFENQKSIGDLMLIAIASVLILFIAGFNFINFNISLFRINSKTVGIKKICGSNMFSISFQAFVDAFIIFCISSFFAFTIIYSLQSFINGFLKQPVLSPDKFLQAIPILLFSGFLIAFICGFLPSLRYTRKEPALLMKRNFKIGQKEIAAGWFLFSLQFMISIIILISFFVINKQVNLLTDHPLGFDKENVLIIHRTERDREKAKSLADELRKFSDIKAVSLANAYPGGSLPSKDLQLLNSPNGFSYSPQYFCCDKEMMNVLNINLLKGEFFSNQSPDNSILLNETALRTYGIEKDPIGKTFTRNSGKDKYLVIGVIKDFNFKSLHQSVEPLCIYTGIDNSNSLYSSKILLKMKKRDKKTLDAIKNKWNDIYKNSYFEYSFLQDEINSLYSKEVFLKRIIPIFTILAFVISIIGLIGIIFINMNEKTKEIGIRKVNGAKTTEIMTMLNKDFLKWVAIAFIIACPIAYYAMHKWLENFAYKTALSCWVFALAGVIAMAIALLTVSWQSYKASIRNPVEALRSE